MDLTQLARTQNGTLLLQTCSQHEIAISNGFFQLANNYNTTWQHPRQLWHTLDHIITRQRDIKDVHITRDMRGTVCWSDHRFLHSVVVLDLCPPQCHRAVRRCNLDVAKLRSEECQQHLQETKAEKLQLLEEQPAGSSVEEKWSNVKDITYKAALEVLGYTVSKHKDWFDDQDTAACAPPDAMHSAQLLWTGSMTNPTQPRNQRIPDLNSKCR